MHLLTLLVPGRAIVPLLKSLYLRLVHD